MPSLRDFNPFNYNQYTAGNVDIVSSPPGINEARAVGDDSTVTLNPPNDQGDPLIKAAKIENLSISGGLAGVDKQLIFPVFDTRTGKSYFCSFDINDFNSEVPALITYRAEELLPGRQVTVSRVRLIYRDLGQFNLTAFVSTTQITKQLKKQFGGRRDGNIYTDYFDMLVTGERPQLSFYREANEGPVSIIAASLITDVELAEQV